MEKQQANFIKEFNPIWFATVLGFGGIAIASILVARLFNALWLNPFAAILIYFNLVLFVFLFATWSLKAIIYFGLLVGELKHPVMAGFHSLMPAATIMISINFSNAGQIFALWQYQGMSIFFWIIGAVFEFVLLTVTIYFLIVNEEMDLNHINGGWLVPPVAALLTPVAGLRLVEFISHTSLAESILWVNYFFFGAGVCVFFMISIALFSKIFFFKKLDPKVFPSLWIILVPFSLMALSISLFAKETATYLPEFKNIFMGIVFLVNPVLIGVGVWLLILLIILTTHYLKKIGLPWGAGWWAFVFPTASVAIASLNQTVVVGQSFFAYCGLGVYLLLIAITVMVLSRTIKSFVSSR